MMFLIVLGCAKPVEVAPIEIWDSITVEASAYNSTPAQTSSTPQITAFGDSLKPGVKYIAVSRDLLRMGIKHNTPVVIEGFDGVYLVKDKMHPKWRKHIDIYMGKDIEAAREWGRRTVCIEYKLSEEAIKKASME
ncbi:3D domain-containing protein [Gelidibacter sediminis]|nr:3D domain-containing protein [Gelidibacter sediminis]